MAAKVSVIDFWSALLLEDISSTANLCTCQQADTMGPMPISICPLLVERVFSTGHLQ